jgi:hypothetical protein
MVRNIFESVKYKNESGQVLIGEMVTFNKRKLWPLITAKLVNE